jgi:hypothetical protein
VTEIDFVITNFGEKYRHDLNCIFLATICIFHENLRRFSLFLVAFGDI